MFVLYLMPVSCACDCVVCQNLRRLHLLDIHCSNSTAVILVHHIFPKMQKLGNMDLADPSGSMQTKLPANVPAVAPKEKPRIGEPFSNLIWTLVSMQRWKIGRFTLVNRPLRLQPRRSTDTWPSDRLKIHEFYRGWSVSKYAEMLAMPWSKPRRAWCDSATSPSPHIEPSIGLRWSDGRQPAAVDLPSSFSLHPKNYIYI